MWQLRQSQRFERQPAAWAKLIDEVLPLHETHPSDWKRWLFYLMCRNEHRDSRKMKKQGNTFQTKKQDKSPATNLNEMGINYLPGGIQNISYKEDH